MIHNPSIQKNALMKPSALQKGDKIGIISPSASIQGRQEYWERMRQFLTAKGYEVLMGAYAEGQHGYLAGTDAQRLLDFHVLWSDPSVKAIWCSQGGYGAMRLLEVVNYSMIAQNPKLFIGYSDITALLWGIHQKTGLVTFHGPLAASDFGKETTDLFAAQEVFRMVSGEANYQIPYTLPNANPFYRCLRPGVAEGPLYVGNLQLITALLGTPYFPDLTGCILMVEDLGGYIYLLDRMLMSLKLSGILNRLAGLVFGEFIYMQERNTILPINMVGAPSVLELLESFSASLNIPVGYGVSCGHSDAKSTYPIGIQTRFEGETGMLQLMESYLND
ncbi:MAG: LD-carboxypeptidase [Cyanobacteria bacterium]|nr:LD-carboxypeptidase [Cyanobacteriota bacterium]